MGRNGNGVTQTSETSYEIAFSYRGIRCRERIKLKPSPANRKRLENHLGAIKDAIDKGTFDYATTFPDSPRRFQFYPKAQASNTLETYLEGWLQAKEKQLKASTHYNYVKIYKIIVAQFPNKPINELKRSDLRTWLSALNVGNKRLTNIQSMLRAALQDAVDDEVLDSNPLYGWKYINKEVVKEHDDVDPFSLEEQAELLSKFTGQELNMFAFFFWTGLRTSELVALSWGDVDWLNGTIRVNKARTQASKEDESTKTRAGIRDVKLLAPALNALLQQKQYSFLNGDEIFQNPRTGKRWNGDLAIRDAWQRGMKRSKVRYRRPYQTRHTYASMMLTAGEHPMWVSNQMGHSDQSMINRIYGRFMPNRMIDSGQKAVEMFGGNAGINAVITTPNNPKKQA